MWQVTVLMMEDVIKKIIQTYNTLVEIYFSLTNLPQINKYSRDTCGYILQKCTKLLNTRNITAGLIKLFLSPYSRAQQVILVQVRIKQNK